MMRGLLRKALREIWGVTLILGLAMVIVKTVLTAVLPSLQNELSEFVAQMPFVQNMLSALLGMDVQDGVNAMMMQSILWVHPVVLTVMWAHETIVCTRVPAGEVDRGTIDLLLGLPVSRRRVYLAETVAWLTSGAFVLALGVVGHLLAVGRIDPAHRPDAGQIGMILANMMALYIAVGGIAMLASACSDRRGRAVGVVIGLVLGSFLLNFIAQFWDPARPLVFLSVLDYYQPATILQGGGFPWRDVLVLLGVGGVSWAIGGEILARRSLCTV